MSSERYFYLSLQFQYASIFAFILVNIPLILFITGFSLIIFLKKSPGRLSYQEIGWPFLAVLFYLVMLLSVEQFDAK